MLQRLELKHLSQLDTLRTLMHNSAVRLENSHDASEPGVVIQHPAVATGTFNHAAPENPVTTKTDPVRWVYVAQPEPQSNIDVVAALPEPVKPRVFLRRACAPCWWQARPQYGVGSISTSQIRRSSNFWQPLRHYLQC